MPVWEIVGLVILGLTLLVLSIRFGFFGVFIEIICAIFSGGSSRSSKGGSSFGGGDSGGGGSSDDW